MNFGYTHFNSKYANSFLHNWNPFDPASPQVLSAIRSGPNGAIAVSFIEWSSVNEQRVVVDWSVIRVGEGAAMVCRHPDHDTAGERERG